jgi:hypothetical protein
MKLPQVLAVLAPQQHVHICWADVLTQLQDKPLIEKSGHLLEVNLPSPACA